ncbi:MAG: hypothetical protein NUV77_15390 [Thermoguttaceae bacterium]|nr:hypothetical protein [Thermoguttaceae bacterium]
MRTLHGLWTLAALAMCAAMAAAAESGATACCGAPDRCADCGCRDACQPKVCQIVCGTQKIKKHCWCIESEEFCPLLPGRPDGGSCRDCAEGCGGTGCCGQCGEGCKKYVTPQCGRPKTVKKLVKKEYECEVPQYKCVVKYLCGDCCGKAVQGGPAAPTPAPKAAPAPAPKAAPALPAKPKPAPNHSAFEVAPLPPL